MEREMLLESGGVRVNLNRFSRRVVLNTVVALVGSLHDVDPRGEIRIGVKPAPAALDSAPPRS
jgi:hypothetical protein